MGTGGVCFENVPIAQAPGTALYASRRQRVSAARFSAAARDNSESLRLELARKPALPISLSFFHTKYAKLRRFLKT